MSINELFRLGGCIYENPLAAEHDVDGFRMEGSAHVTFATERMRLENALDPALGQQANFVYWCPHDFPASVLFSWEFTPIREPGLAMFFFAARGAGDVDIFDSSLAARTGEYQQYYDGDINTLHASYFRRKHKSERSFHTCNLRKSKGFHLVAQGADPLPSVADVDPPYRITVVKYESEVFFAVNDLLIYHFVDDSRQYGPILSSGKVGFRQMAPLVAEYGNFSAHEVLGPR